MNNQVMTWLPVLLRNVEMRDNFRKGELIMSLAARIMIAISCFIATVAFALSAAFGLSTADAWKFWIMASVCFIATLCCFRGKHSPITNRIMGAIIFFVYVAYLISEIYMGRFFKWSFAKPCVKNALIGSIIYGLPALYVMIYGHLPIDFSSNHSGHDYEEYEDYEDDEPEEN